MSILRFTTGADAHTQEKFPKTPNSDSAYPIVGGTSGARKRLLVRPSDIAAALRGQTVLSLSVSVPMRGPSAEFAAVWSLLTGGFGPLINWNRGEQIGLVSNLSRTWPATTVDKQRVEMDLTPLGVQIAAGQPFYGFRVGTNAAGDWRVYGFDSGADSWIFTAEIADDSDAPVALEPNGGVVGIAQPVLAWQADDGDQESGISGSQTQYRLQVEVPPAEDDPTWTTPDLDVTVPSVLSQHDLAGGTFSAPEDALCFWRVMTLDAGGQWSDWSDPATFIFDTRPSLTFISPSAGQIFDPSPTIQVQSNKPIAAYRIVVSDAVSGLVRYDSELQGWTDLAQNTLLTEQVPVKHNGALVFSGADSYRIDVSVIDDTEGERVDSPGDPAATTVSTTVVYSSGPEPAPTSLTAEQVTGFPEVRLRWTRSAAADSWVIERNGEVIASIEADESLPDGQAPIVPDGPGVWTWVDRDARGGKEQTYFVRALPDGGQQSRRSPAATITPFVKGVWIVRPNGDRVVLEGDPDVAQSDRRVTYEGLNAQAPFDIIMAQLGIAGKFDGSVSLAWHDRDLDAALAILRAIRANPTQAVRLVWGEHNIPAKLANVSVVTGVGDGATAYRANTRAHRVSFDLWQVDEFETER